MVTFSKNIVNISGKEIEFPCEIQEILELDEILIIQTNYQKTKDPRNVCGYSKSDGERLWQIKEGIKVTASSPSTPYANIWIENGVVFAGHDSGIDYTLDPKTGKVEPVKGRRPW